MGLQDVVRWILPREDHFYTYLENLAVASHDAAVALAKWKDPSTSGQSVCDAVQVIEHRADGIQKELEDALALTFVTPLDREDLHRLGAELDDVVDLTNLAARAIVLFGLSSPTEAMVTLIDTLVECTKVLRNSVPKLRKHEYPDLVEAARELRKSEKTGDKAYRDEISRLFRDDSIDAKTALKQREVLEDLERAIDHCDHVATTLSNLAVKHG
ncbi:MAG: DUF47 family protein [Polyangiaceae bacterium]|nr:DUF47 family protein [Polyangiaceae bacterium]